MMNKNLIQCKEANSYQLYAFFSIEIQQIINNGLKSLESEAEFILLDIIETVVERGTQMNKIASRGYFEQIFYQNMIKSKLLEKIKNLFQQQFQKEKQKYKNQFSKLTEQLTRIYLFASKQQRIEYSMIDICVEVITCNILKSFEVIKKITNDEYEKKKIIKLKDDCSDDGSDYDEEQSNDEEDNEELDEIFDIGYKNIQIWKKNKLNNEQQNNDQKEQHQQTKEDFNNQIKSTILIINALQSILSSNIQYLVDNFKIHEKIAPFIHMNCHQSLKCIHTIYVQLTPDLYTLQSLIYDILRELSSNNNVQQYLLSQHSIHSHIVSIIQYSSDYYQINSNLTIQYQNQISPNTQFSDLISTSIKFFNDFLISSSSNIKSSFSQPEFISLIIKILNNKQFYNSNNKINFEIKEKIIICIKEISVNNIQLQQILIDSNYIGALSQLIGIAGGNENETNQYIYHAILNLKDFLSRIQYEKDQDKCQQLFLPTQFIKSAEEQIEFEGGLEEIESQIFNKVMDINLNSVKIQQIISNRFDDHSDFDMKQINEKPDNAKKSVIQNYIRIHAMEKEIGLSDIV